jgi:hypothetical protein
MAVVEVLVVLARARVCVCGWVGGYLQNTQRLEASEGALSDVADGVVSQTQAVEVPQHGQTALVQTGQVIVRQIPGERGRGRVRLGRRPERVRRNRDIHRERKSWGKMSVAKNHNVRSGRRRRLAANRGNGDSIKKGFPRSCSLLAPTVMLFSSRTLPQDV